MVFYFRIRSFEDMEQKSVVQRPLREKRIKEAQFLKGKAKEYDALIKNLQVDFLNCRFFSSYTFVFYEKHSKF